MNKIISYEILLDADMETVRFIRLVAFWAVVQPTNRSNCSPISLYPLTIRLSITESNKHRQFTRYE